MAKVLEAVQIYKKVEDVTAPKDDNPPGVCAVPGGDGAAAIMTHHNRPRGGGQHAARGVGALSCAARLWPGAQGIAEPSCARCPLTHGTHTSPAWAWGTQCT